MKLCAGHPVDMNKINMNRVNQQALKLVGSLSEAVQNKANRVYALYENYFGIAELKNVQLGVLKVRGFDWKF